jgi:hypothetical protein
MRPHLNVLSEKQLELLSLATQFSTNFGLVGGTAIALQIGHRQSIDFDLFSLEKFTNADIRKIVIQNNYQLGKVFKDEEDQFIFNVDTVQFTFLHYPFKIKFNKSLENHLKMPDLVTLAAMKAYTLGRRAKWKDYVDLFFILKNHFSLKEVVTQGKQIFQNEFNEKNFREQLAYFDDVDYTEEVMLLPKFEVRPEIIKKSLVNFSLE